MKFARAVLAIAATVSWTLATPASAATSIQPSQYFDLSHWKLTLPVDADGGTSGVAAEVWPSQLTDYSSTWFEVGKTGQTLNFYAPVDGATTSGSHYPRSELREVVDPNDDNVNWHISGRSELEGKCKVQLVPSATGKVIVGQIHGFQAKPLVKLVYHYSDSSMTGSVYALIHPTPYSSTNVKLSLASGIDLGKAFGYRIKVDSGELKMRVNSNNWVSYQIDSSWGNVGLYFKLGDYVQASGTSDTDGGWVSFYRLIATHPNHGLAIATGGRSLDDAVSNNVYSQTLSYTGGYGDANWSVVNGKLPAGLSLNSSGVISGMPMPVTKDTTYYFSLLVTDQAGDTAAKNYALTIKAP